MPFNSKDQQRIFDEIRRISDGIDANAKKADDSYDRYFDKLDEQFNAMDRQFDKMDDDIQGKVNKVRSRYQDIYSGSTTNTSPSLLLSLLNEAKEFLKTTFKDISSTVGGGGGNGRDNQPPFYKGMFNMINKKIIGGLALMFLTLAISPLMFGINDAGHRTVIQYPNGTMVVKFDPGFYLQYFGRVDEYNDVITFDFDKTENAESSTLDQQGIAVRYQDGGTGHVYGNMRFGLPVVRADMLKLHKDFRSNRGVANKIIKQVTEESMNLTAGLLTSEEAYAEKRGTFGEWARDQVSKGKFKTKSVSIDVLDEATGKSVSKKVPRIVFGEDGLAMHAGSDLVKYGISVTGFQLVDWGFEEKTLKQISDKREATMAIITAKANAARAKQDTITAEEQGKANVKIAQYEEEVIKEKAVVQAERKAEVAVIKATQLVDVAAQHKLQAEQKQLAAIHYKKEQILIGQGDSERKKLVIEADGALEQKLEAYVKVNANYAREFGKQKWVPEIEMGSNGGNTGGNAAMSIIEMLGVKAAKDLALDLKVK